MGLLVQISLIAVIVEGLSVAVDIVGHATLVTTA
jgi:hypothetical protein